MPVIFALRHDEKHAHVHSGILNSKRVQGRLHVEMVCHCLVSVRKDHLAPRHAESAWMCVNMYVCMYVCLRKVPDMQKAPACVRTCMHVCTYVHVCVYYEPQDVQKACM